jgi:predicted outer membrane protein
MRQNLAIVSGLAALVSLAGATGCSSQKQAEAPLQSHAEIWAAHQAATQSRTADATAFAIGDTLGASMIRDAQNETLEDSTFVLATSKGFIAGDALGVMTMKTPNISTLAGAEDED